MNRKDLNAIAQRYLDELILVSEPLRPLWNRENFIFKKPARWNYIDSCMIMAVLMLWEISGDERLFDFAKRFIDAYVMPDGSIPTMNSGDFNLDNINGGKILLYLWKATGEDRYRSGAEKLWSGQLVRQPRLECGSFWHKAIYPRQLWLDGAYMALPFMAEYSILTGDDDIKRDVLMQLDNIRNIMQNRDTGLYYHGYDETRTMNWADPVTGLSQEYWLRSVGWLCAGLADICGYLPSEALCCDMLRELLCSLRGYVTDGMLYQLPAYSHGELSGNYPETSGTLLIAYAAMKAERLGICGGDISETGRLLLDTTAERYISTDGDVPVLRNICLMGGLGGEQKRDGSVQYYLSERRVENDAKGIAPLLMAYSELLRHDSSQ
ncbi:MAG: glycoside hydrolase family 88 protein [Ruminococcus sp.]|nr:glycoside hydrolase family 88 protein [Ruminococcus sp.]